MIPASPYAFVLDCSVAIAWFLNGQATPQTKELLKRAPFEHMLVPSLFHLELVNVLLVSERKKNATAAEITEFFAILDTFTIITDHETHLRAAHDTRALAHTHKLSAYDAAYLELAMRTGTPLATRDTDLIKAARKAGVRLA